MTSPSTGPRLAAAFLTPGTSSFAEFLAEQAPELLPHRRSLPEGSAADLAPHGTTIVAATFHGGVVMAGDRRATMGNIIAQRDIEKVFPADEYSCVGIAGTAGLAVELVRLFQTELEHYEKIEGTTLSMDGKANRLAALIRSNLGMAMQGLAVVPLFAGFDLTNEQGRIFSYDVTGGRYEETDLPGRRADHRRRVPAHARRRRRPRRRPGHRGAHGASRRPGRPADLTTRDAEDHAGDRARRDP